MNRNKKIKIFFLVIAVILVAATAWIFFQNYSTGGNRKGEIVIGESDFNVEIVDTPEKLEKGLGNRRKICDNCGMLFDFSKSERHSFWMKGMKFGIDIIWIDGNKIVHVEKNVPPEYDKVMNPEVRSDKVLEIKGGTAERIGIKMGDVVEFK